MNGTGLAVPKERQDVTIHLGDGLTVQGTIFLEAPREGATLHQTLLSFLDDEPGFFPLTLKDGSGTEFLQKKNVRIIEMDYSADRERVDLAISLMYRVPVKAVFPDGSSWAGFLIADVPPEKARLSDCLNLPNSFLSVKTDTRICYINKALLRKVVHFSS